MTGATAPHVRRTVSLLAPLLTAGLFVIYATVMYGGVRGQTVGMMAVGVRVVARDGARCPRLRAGLWRASVEQFLRISATVTLILGRLWLLDMLFPLWDKKRQTLHDKVAKTVVIRARPRGKVRSPRSNNRVVSSTVERRPVSGRSFTHLHTHTEFSMLDGAARIGELVAAAAADGQPALGITDHGNMYGVLDFYKACRAQGITPIIGTEAYMAADSRHERPVRRGKVDDTGGDVEGGQKLYYHLTLLSETVEGYRNLLKLSSAAYLEGYYYKPRLDWELLERYHRGSSPRPDAWAGWCSRPSWPATCRRPSAGRPGCRTSSVGRASSSSSRTTASPTSSAPTRN